MQTERLLALAVVVKVFGKNREKVFGKSGKTGKREKSGLFPFSRFSQTLVGPKAIWVATLGKLLGKTGKWEK